MEGDSEVAVDFPKHPPMMTPLISAAVLMIMGGFLMHRMHPGGIKAVLRGEKPKATRTVTIVPSVLPEADPVAWGEPGVLQIGLDAPSRHETRGPVWMGVRLRNNSSTPVSLTAGLKGIMGSGRVMINVLSTDGKTAEWSVPGADLAFNLTVPGNDDVRLPFRFEEPQRTAVVSQTNNYTVSLSIEGVGLRTEKGTIGPVDLETGGIVLTRCWAPDEPDKVKGADADDDGLGIRTSDITIPVPTSGGQ